MNPEYFIHKHIVFYSKVNSSKVNFNISEAEKSLYIIQMSIQMNSRHSKYILVFVHFLSLCWSRISKNKIKKFTLLITITAIFCILWASKMVTIKYLCLNVIFNMLCELHTAVFENIPTAKLMLQFLFVKKTM